MQFLSTFVNMAQFLYRLTRRANFYNQYFFTFLKLLNWVFIKYRDFVIVSQASFDIGK